MNKRLNSFERFISLFTTVRPGEGLAVAVYFTYACLIIISYYVFKTLREPLIIGSSSAEAKSYATALAAVVLFFFMPIYSKMVNSCTREQLLVGLALMFAAMGLGFAMLHSMGYRIGYPYYVWVSIYGVIMVTQFWVFANGSFNVKTGKRLFPVILIGASLGGLIGAQIAKYVIGNMGVGSGIATASIIIGVTSFFPRIARNAVPAESMCVDCHLYKPDEKKSSILGGIGVVFRSRLMILIAGYALMLNIVNSTGEYIFAEALTTKADQLGLIETAEREKYIGQTYAQFAFWVTSIALFLQMFVVSRIFIHYGVCVAAMVMPIALTIGYALGGFFPIFTFIYMLKVLDNSLDYSITNTVRQALFLPTTHEEKFEAKTAIDTLFWRLGDLVQAGVVFVAINWLGWGIREISLSCAVLGVGWIICAQMIVKEYRIRVAEHTEEAPRLNRPIGIVPVVPGAEFNLPIPSDTFSAADPADCLSLDAKLSGDEKLPKWLAFSSKKRCLSGQIPNKMSEDLDIKLIARDNTGLSAENVFTLKPSNTTNND